MKKLFVLFYSLVIAVNSFASDSIDINPKIERSFDSSFPNATNVKWQELANTYSVVFEETGIRYRIEYAKDQSFLYITRYYRETQLPYHMRYAIKKKYPEKSIFGITEVSSVSTDTALNMDYYIILEDAKKWIVVKMNNAGNSTIVQRIRKE